MSRRRLIILAALVLIFGGFLFVRAPKPVIAIAPEFVAQIGGYTITNTILSAWVVIALLVIGAYFIYRRTRNVEQALVPSGLQNLVEALYEAFFGIVEQVVGERNGRRFFPVVFTIFIFVLMGNWFGLFPWNNVIGQVENVREHYLHEMEIGAHEVVEELKHGERAISAAEIGVINDAFQHAFFEPIPFELDELEHADEQIEQIREHHLTDVERAVRSEFAVNPIPSNTDGSDVIHAIEERLEAAGYADVHDGGHDLEYAVIWNLPMTAADTELVRADGPILSGGGLKIIPPRTLFDTPRDYSYDAFAEPLLIEPAADGSVAQLCLIECGLPIGDHQPAVVPTTVNTAHLGFILRLEEQGFEGETVGHVFPFFRAIATDVNLPLALALWSLIMVQLWGVRGVGLANNFGKYIGLGSHAVVKGPMGLFVGILEIISEVGRIISFTFRLFGNIFAGEVVLFISMFLAAFIVPSVFFGLEIFVGFIQAFVFAMLTLVFAGAAVAGHDDHHEESEEGAR